MVEVFDMVFVVLFVTAGCSNPVPDFLSRPWDASSNHWFTLPMKPVRHIKRNTQGRDMFNYMCVSF